MSEQTEQTSLRDQVLAWLHQNSYQRASFDRLISHVQNADTYEQLRDMVNEHHDIFRGITLKGGFEGLALKQTGEHPVQVEHPDPDEQTSVEGSFQHLMKQLESGKQPEADLPVVYPNGPSWGDLRTEEYREYTFRNGQVIRINRPIQLQIGEIVEGRIGGPAHFIAAADGIGHHIPAGWLQLSWKTKAGKEIFNA